MLPWKSLVCYLHVSLEPIFFLNLYPSWFLLCILENVLQVFAQLICQALCYLESESCVQFSDDSLVACYDSLAGQDFNQFIHFLKPNTQQFQPDSKYFPMKIFDTEVQPVLSSVAKILGKDDDSTVDKSILGMFAMMMKPGMVLDIPSY